MIADSNHRQCNIRAPDESLGIASGCSPIMVSNIARTSLMLVSSSCSEFVTASNSINVSTKHSTRLFLATVNAISSTIVKLICGRKSRIRKNRWSISKAELHLVTFRILRRNGRSCRNLEPKANFLNLTISLLPFESMWLSSSIISFTGRFNRWLKHPIKGTPVLVDKDIWHSHCP